MSSVYGARVRPIIVTLIIAFMLSMAPMPAWAANFRPDWVVMTLIYWSMTQPRTYSVGTAWVIGLVLDVANGTLLGQHALALCLVIYVTVKFHLQMRQFPPMQLTATVFALLSLYQFILFWVNGVAGVNAPAVTYWGPVLSGMLLWPLISMYLSGLQVRVQR